MRMKRRKWQVYWTLCWTKILNLFIYFICPAKNIWSWEGGPGLYTWITMTNHNSYHLHLPSQTNYTDYLYFTMSSTWKTKTAWLRLASIRGENGTSSHNKGKNQTLINSVIVVAGISYPISPYEQPLSPFSSLLSPFSSLCLLIPFTFFLLSPFICLLRISPFLISLSSPLSAP